MSEPSLTPERPRRRANAGRDSGPLLDLQARALRYFLENQRGGGLILDRQANHGPVRAHGLCSTAATGMGWIAVGLASLPPYRLVSRAEALDRVRTGVTTALEKLPHVRGVMPHFVRSTDLAVDGVDRISTIDSAWLIAGSLAAAELLGDHELQDLAGTIADRVDWAWWTGPDEPNYSGLLRHGLAAGGGFLRCNWDRLNAETLFMYVLAAGGRRGSEIPAAAVDRLGLFPGRVGDRTFPSGDLGLFVSQYSLELLDLTRWRRPDTPDLVAVARVATEANIEHCRSLAGRFETYRSFWGLSAGDGPDDDSGPDRYRAYSPHGPIDGTAHLTAALASVSHCPEPVLDQVRRARTAERPCLGRYGFSSVNLDREWVSRDVVGIDIAVAALAVDNWLSGGRVREAFHQSSQVRRGLAGLGFVSHAV